MGLLGPLNPNPKIASQCRCLRAGAGLDKTVEQTRAVVASLNAALAFTRALSGALPLLTQLLARCNP